VSRGPSILLIRAKAWELLARGFRCGAHLTAPNTVLFPSTSKWQNRAEWLSSRSRFARRLKSSGADWPPEQIVARRVHDCFSTDEKV
jgi:hypothetical protein